MDTEKLLNWLREQNKNSQKLARLIAEEAGKEFNAEDFAVAHQIQGEATAYLYVIKYIKGLNEREFQLQRKKGIL